MFMSYLQSFIQKIQQMKKIVLGILLLSAGPFGYAQIQRNTPPAAMDTASLPARHAHAKGNHDMKKILHSLDLSKEQKSQIKAINQQFKSEKQTIINNTQLSDAEKKQQLKNLKLSRSEKINDVLTVPQRQKLKEERDRLKMQRRQEKKA